MSSSIKFIPIKTQHALANALVKGHDNQMVFLSLRAQNIDVTYQQVVAYRNHMNSQFEGSFASIFHS